MRAKTNSDIAALLGVRAGAGESKIVELKHSVVCTMKPTYGRPYDIEVFALDVQEHENGKSRVIAMFSFESSERGMACDQFTADCKKRIEAAL